MSRLSRLLRPRTVALVGGSLVNRLVESCEEMGFTGEIWPVNPDRKRLAGLECFPDLGALPSPPDAAFLAVNRGRTIEAVANLAEMGAGSAVCYASLFSEQGSEGAAYQRRLVEAAGDMPILGPNCYGLVNAVDGVALWPDLLGCEPVSEGVALISQSGNVGMNLSFQGRQLPVSHLVTVGNQAVVGIEDLMEELLEDRRVKGLGLFLEAVRDPARFLAAARRALAVRVPVVALMVGRSRRGAEIARSHTASISGMTEAYRALFDRGGVMRVDTIPELLETLGVLVGVGPLRGNRIVSMSCSGGEASYVADLSESTRLDFAPFPSELAARVERILEGRVKVGNPLDYHTFIWDDRARLERLFREVTSGPQDATMLVLDLPDRDGDFAAFWKTARAMVTARSVSERPALVVSGLPENLSADLARELAAAGVTPVRGIAEALAGLDAAVRWGDVVHSEPPVSPAAVPPPGDRLTHLDEAAAKERLAEWGMAVPRGKVTPASGVEDVAAAIGYPVTIKVVGIDHKTEEAGVKVGIPTPADLNLVLAEMSERYAGPFLVEETVGGVVAELLVSVRRQWPVGWLVALGAGGVLTELVDDFVHFLAPVDRREVRAGIEKLKIGRLLAGYRGAPAADLDACVAAICHLVDGVLGDEDVVEVEVNPLLATASGAVAADALLSLSG
ncbi:MAG: acetate--CoA ligase family protein [bacterium]|nr:acetate--CoA ligase family protein [bacterium]